MLNWAWCSQSCKTVMQVHSLPTVLGKFKTMWTSSFEFIRKPYTGSVAILREKKGGRKSTIFYVNEQNNGFVGTAFLHCSKITKQFRMDMKTAKLKKLCVYIYVLESSWVSLVYSWWDGCINVVFTVYSVDRRDHCLHFIDGKIQKRKFIT